MSLWLGAIWVTYNQQWEELLPPPSVVMEISIESQAEQLTEVNIGQLQELGGGESGL